ncbi:MAG: hypothetical protein Q4F88_02650 [Eubacteriales bacterium]|nr:hypothetical protein [Eubacteriales bacterium]
MNNLLHDLSVDDIHNLRVENSKLMEKMSSDEISHYIEEETNDFRKLLKRKIIQF